MRAIFGNDWWTLKATFHWNQVPSTYLRINANNKSIALSQQLPEACMLPYFQTRNIAWFSLVPQITTRFKVFPLWNTTGSANSLQTTTSYYPQITRDPAISKPNGQKSNARNIIGKWGARGERGRERARPSGNRRSSAAEGSPQHRRSAACTFASGRPVISISRRTHSALARSELGHASCPSPPLPPRAPLELDRGSILPLASCRNPRSSPERLGIPRSPPRLQKTRAVFWLFATVAAAE